MNDNLRLALRQLRLSGLKDNLDLRLQEAAANRLGHEQFLELALEDELAVRRDRTIRRRVAAARFAGLKTLDQFNWEFNPNIDRARMYELASGEFIRQARDVLFVGPPGVGKSHLAQAIGYQAIKLGFAVFYRSVFDLVRDFAREELLGESRTMKRYLKPELLIVDDMGLKQLPKHAGEHLFEVVMRRHENRSTMMTSNRPIEEWGKLIGDVPAAGAILDRFLQHAEVVSIAGRSYRLQSQGGKEAA